MVAFLTLLTVVSCNKKNLEQGGQDSGGGDIAGATPEQIETLFSESERLESELKTILQNLKQADLSNKNDKTFLRKWARRFEKSGASISEILRNIDLDDTCKDLHNNEKSAAVSDFSTDGRICLSKTDLAKNLPEVLKKQTHAIIFHEISHLMGLKEGPAQKTQTLILKYYDKLTESGASYVMQNQLITTSEKARENIALLQKRIATNNRILGDGFDYIPVDRGTMYKIKEIDSDLEFVANAAKVLTDQMEAKFKNKNSILFDRLKRLVVLPGKTRAQVNKIVTEGSAKALPKLRSLYGNHYQYLLETEKLARSFH